MFDFFENFRRHRRTFNVVFSTTLAIILSVTIGAVLAWIKAIHWNNPDAVVIILILVVFPIIVFLAVSENTKLKPAYYETWKDRRMGRKDRKKILEQFARQYKIKDWKTKVHNITADGRWKFHANTKYMYVLARERDQALSDLSKEYIKKCEDVNIIIMQSEKDIAGLQLQLEFAEDEQKQRTKRVDEAKSSREVYQQRRDFEDSRRRVAEVEQQLNAEKYDLKTHIEAKNNLDKLYRRACGDIEYFYYDRYSKYMEIAIEKINKINGLRYVVDDMPSTER